MDNTTLPLHLSHVQKSSSIINRSHTLLHSTALIALIYYRIASFFQTTKPSDLPTTFSCLLVFTGELILSFIWFLGQAYRFRPVTRTVFPERLPENVELPAVDVFICTADPSKEPTLEVMNIVISAIALDYPPDKLHVYLSDDGGCSVTLEAMKEAWRFAKGYWVPYCRAYGIKTRCPEAYFLGEEGNTESSSGSEFMADRERVKEKYENFKSRVTRIRQNSTIIVNRDHAAVVEVINDVSIDEASQEDKAEEMPLLVYVSREKRPSLPHHFKAGALNVLAKVAKQTWQEKKLEEVPEDSFGPLPECLLSSSYRPLRGQIREARDETTDEEGEEIEMSPRNIIADLEERKKKKDAARAKTKAGSSAGGPTNQEEVADENLAPGDATESVAEGSTAEANAAAIEATVTPEA
ncbi:hypothetical protein RHGRI_003560 [Rhododendron griersonianum]|uniref:Uncharacterized protein n=1 Tax=Rhododendron griersonianum TaxID=479676 RepID=A0AAV6L7T2_9ERIC|nr:hypothetical protein RHGRI_003560 [Rhododendron griersonianum]